MIIDETEAKVVRSIFDMYLSGYSIVGIVKELERRGVKSPTDKDRWSKRTIETMLSNEKYIGNVLIGKTYCKEYPNNKRLPNRGEREKYFSTGGHPLLLRKNSLNVLQQKRRGEAMFKLMNMAP